MEDFSSWFYEALGCIFSVCFVSNILWLLMYIKEILISKKLINRTAPDEYWWLGTGLLKKICVWSYCLTVIGINGVTAIAQIENTETQIPKRTCAIMVAVANSIGAGLTLRLLFHQTHWGTGTGFLSTILVAIFKWIIAFEAAPSWELYGSSAMLAAMSSYVPIMHDLLLDQVEIDYQTRMERRRRQVLHLE